MCYYYTIIAKHPLIKPPFVNSRMRRLLDFDFPPLMNLFFMRDPALIILIIYIYIYIYREREIDR